MLRQQKKPQALGSGSTNLRHRVQALARLGCRLPCLPFEVVEVRRIAHRGGDLYVPYQLAVNLGEFHALGQHAGGTEREALDRLVDATNADSPSAAIRALLDGFDRTALGDASAYH